MTFSEAAMIMMSGGGGPSSGALIKRLKEAPALQRIEIAEGWNIQVKISDADEDNSVACEFITGSSYFPEVRHKLRRFRTYWIIYYCVYYNDIFKYAMICPSELFPKYDGGYGNKINPDIEIESTNYDIISVASCKTTVTDDPARWLEVRMEFNIEITSVSRYYDSSSDSWITNDPYTYSSAYTSVADSFSGLINNYSIPIYEGNFADIKESIIGLYNACTTLMPEAE